MLKEELSAEERIRISRLGGQARGKALTPKQREDQARAAANMRHHGVARPRRRKRPGKTVIPEPPTPPTSS